MSEPSPSSTSTTRTPQPRKAPKQRIHFSSSDPAAIIASNQTVASPFQIEKHKREAARNWDLFYKNHEKATGGGFFKSRHWTANEWDVLPTIGGGEEGGKGKGKVVLEVGCGTGAFVYPLLDEYPGSRFHAFDFSKRAVDLVKQHEHFTSSRVHAFVHDLTSGTTALRTALASAPAEFWSFPSPPPSDPSPPPNIQPDVVACIFVLSALPPKTQKAAVKALVDVLAPGGTLLLRDYALHDEAQLRFHALPSKSYASIPSLLSPPLLPSTPGAPLLPPTADDEEKGRAWYRRGDSTLCYFYTAEEIVDLVEGAVAEGVDEEGRKWRMEGGAKVVEREMENRAEGWGCTRKFVQGTWVKVLVEQ